MKKRTKTTAVAPHRYVIRVDSDARRTHGWHGRRQTPGSTKYKSRLFSDKKWGGRDAAYLMAERWALMGRA